MASALTSASFGKTKEPFYLAMNPNSLVPTLEDEDGFTLWESNSVVRYLAAKHRSAIEPAEAKARAVAPKQPDALIIGSDQVAEFHGEPVGKPRDSAHALELLQTMRGHTVIFHTAVALLNARTGVCRNALVDVISSFRHVGDAALQAYLDREQPFDCAGAVKSEGLGIALFTRIASDDPTALIGLPLIRLIDLLAAEGVRPL
jgi:septum formation protein